MEALEGNILRLIGILISAFGIFLLCKPALIADKLKSFYSNYPLVRYAGDKQLRSRPGLVRVAGVVFIAVGLICFFSVQ